MIIVGNRGVPALYGGFETFAENLILCSLRDESTSFKCVNASDNFAGEYQDSVIYSRFSKDKKPMLFYLDSLILGAKNSNHVLVTGTAGSFFYPLIRVINPKVKIHTNVDGVESRRQRWSSLKRHIIKISEYLSLIWSDTIICDSEGIKDYINRHYAGRYTHKCVVIEYGAMPIDSPKKKTKSYFLIVARFVPENNIITIVRAAKSLPDEQFVFIGDYSNNYGQMCIDEAESNCNFIGGVYDKTVLRDYRINAKAYIHGHSVGGTNPSLLEAMACGNYCLPHDNNFNREVCQDNAVYWSTVKDLVKSIKGLVESELRYKDRVALHERILNYYNWDRIYSTYKKLL